MYLCVLCAVNESKSFPCWIYLFKVSSCRSFSSSFSISVYETVWDCVLCIEQRNRVEKHGRYGYITIACVLFSPPQTSYTSALALAQETISANIYSLECFFVAISTASKYIIIVCVSFRGENERERELKEFVKLLLVLPTSLMLLFNDILLHQGFNAALKHLVVSEKSKWALHASCFYQFIRHMSLAFSDFFLVSFSFAGFLPSSHLSSACL